MANLRDMVISLNCNFQTGAEALIVCTLIFSTSASISNWFPSTLIPPKKITLRAMLKCLPLSKIHSISVKTNKNIGNKILLSKYKDACNFIKHITLLFQYARRVFRLHKTNQWGSHQHSWKVKLMTKVKSIETNKIKIKFG